jgi:hypothetical protein
VPLEPETVPEEVEPEAVLAADEEPEVEPELAAPDDAPELEPVEVAVEVLAFPLPEQPSPPTASTATSAHPRSFVSMVASLSRSRHRY